MQNFCIKKKYSTGSKHKLHCCDIVRVPVLAMMQNYMIHVILSWVLQLYFFWNVDATKKKKRKKNNSNPICCLQLVLELIYNTLNRNSDKAGWQRNVWTSTGNQHSFSCIPEKLTFVEKRIFAGYPGWFSINSGLCLHLTAVQLGVGGDEIYMNKSRFLRGDMNCSLFPGQECASVTVCDIA